jgi:hypothetical protein
LQVKDNNRIKGFITFARKPGQVILIGLKSQAQVVGHGQDIFGKLMVSFLYLLIIIIFIALAGRVILLFRRQPGPEHLLLFAIVTGLLSQAVIILIGSVVGEGRPLALLSWAGFLFQAILSPLSALMILEMARRAGVDWAKNNAVRAVMWGIIVVLAVLSLKTGFWRLKFIPAKFAGLVYYQEAFASGPRIPSSLTMAIIIGLGSAIWRRLNWPWIVVGAIVLFLGEAAPTRLVGPSAASLAEVIFALCLVATGQRIEHPDKQKEPRKSEGDEGK